MREKYLKLNSKFKIGDVQIGGRYGEIPTVLIGSIFYMRHKIVEDSQKGIFSEIKAREIIEKSTSLANKLGVKFMLDVVGETTEALVKYMEFLYYQTNVPLLVNSTSPEVRIGVLQHLHKKDMLDRVVYNSINAFSTEEELKLLKQIPVETAVLQAYNSKSKRANGPLKVLCGNDKSKGLLDLALECNIHNVLVDVPTLDLASVGLVARSLQLVQEQFAVPVGTAPSNGTYDSQWLRNRENVSKNQFRNVDAAVNAYLASHGANFLFYGPVEGFEWVFPATAVVNAMHAYGLRSDGVKPETSEHPFFKIL
ncbi:MAG: tetrahydromethanopterin S-methyltransferase subunit H [Crenarchaeota archaeon]|nr:tetrahydromethanopterin S-methyltransferase subunit H [Thermoproteota archaeon]